MRGHGGPVRALAISADGKTAVSGSFDTSAIRWSLTRNAAEQVLRFHESAVNAVALAPDGRIVTGGEDGRIAIWQPRRAARRARCSKATPRRSWRSRCRRTARRSRRRRGTAPSGSGRSDGGAPRVLEGHQQNVNGVAFTPDGKALVSAGYDLTLRIWPLDGGAPTIVTLPTPLNAVAVARDGEIVAGGADGRVFFLSPAGELRGEIDSRPDADHRGRRVPRRRAGRRRRHPRLGRDHRPRARARWRARWSAPACRCGRRRSFPTTARC